MLHTGLCLAVCGLAAYYLLRYLPSQQPGWETRQEMLKLIGTLPLNAVDVHLDEVTYSVEHSHPELGEFAPRVIAAFERRIAQI